MVSFRVLVLTVCLSGVLQHSRSLAAAVGRKTLDTQRWFAALNQSRR